LGLIPQNVLDDILDKSDIVELIASYIPLKKSGRNFKANCPFHHEKTPSFTVSPDKQIYHCFGCGAGGNAFNFLMKYERVEFIDAVKVLAHKTNVMLPSVEERLPEESSFIKDLYKINELAASYYTSNLLNQDTGKPAHTYLARRNVSKESIVKFRLGYSINAWDGLLKYARQRGVSPDILNKAGLALPSSKDNSFYDRFRHRLIFPIFDSKDKIIAFGARVLDDSLPKYVNSPETPIYTKGRHLYGLNLAKSAIAQADYVIIVEGYMDMISAYQGGVENIVASCGTALTTEQIRLLKRFTNEVVMVYDADQAGQMASLRNLDILITEGLSVRLVSLPTGEDPDSYVNKFGGSGFRKLVENAKDLFSYKLDLLLQKYKKNTPEGKTKIVSEMLPTLSRIPNAVLKSSYLKKLAQDLDIDEEALKIELQKVRGAYSYSYEPDTKQKLDSSGVMKVAERILVTLMLEDSKLVGNVMKELDYEAFQDGTIRKIVKVLYDFYREGKDITPNKIISYLDDESSPELISELISDTHIYNDKEKNLRDCIKWIKHSSLKDRLKILQTEIRAAEVNNDHARLKELLNQYSTLIKERNFICAEEKRSEN